MRRNLITILDLYIYFLWFYLPVNICWMHITTVNPYFLLDYASSYGCVWWWWWWYHVNHKMCIIKHFIVHLPFLKYRPDRYITLKLCFSPFLFQIFIVYILVYIFQFLSLHSIEIWKKRRDLLRLKSNISAWITLHYLLFHTIFFLWKINRALLLEFKIHQLQNKYYFD